MNLVIDANVLFSILIKDSTSRKLFYNLEHSFFAPKLILDEFEKHKEEIINKSHRTEEKFSELLEKLKDIIKIIDEEEFINYVLEAEEISPDPDDVMYFALALKLNCPIWTDDKKLKKQDKIKIYTTNELVDDFM